MQRFKVIVKEAKKRGWLTKERVRMYDDAGVHPDFAAHICKDGRFIASRSKVTALLARNFEGAEAAFRAVKRKEEQLKRA